MGALESVYKPNVRKKTYTRCTSAMQEPMEECMQNDINIVYGLNKALYKTFESQQKLPDNAFDKAIDLKDL